MKFLILGILQFTLLFTLGLTQLSAQDTTKTWVDGSWKQTTKEKAQYFRKEWEENDLWMTHDFYLDGQLQESGSYLTSDRETKEGRFIRYSPDGIKTSEGIYKNGKKVGEWIYWFENGNIKDQGAYTEDSADADQYVYWNKEQTLHDRDSLNVKTGTWKYYHKNGTMSGEEVYEAGVLMSAVYWEDDGTPAAADAEISAMPQFPGGEAALFEYLRNNIKYPPKAIANNYSGTVYVRFTIDEEGNIKDVGVIRGVSPSLDAESLRVVRAMPKWIPGKMQNRYVSVQYNLPIKFTLARHGNKKKRKKKNKSRD